MVDRQEIRDKYYNECKEKYERVFNHPYRVGTKSSLNFYMDTYNEMLDAFHKSVMFEHEVMYGHDFAAMPTKFFHDVGQFVWMIRDRLRQGAYNNDHRRREDMVMLEAYLNQVHRYVNTRDFKRFRLYFLDDWYMFEYFPEDRCYSIADEHLDKYNEKRPITPGLKKHFEERKFDDRLSRMQMSIIRRWEAKKNGNIIIQRETR